MSSTFIDEVLAAENAGADPDAPVPAGTGPWWRRRVVRRWAVVVFVIVLLGALRLIGTSSNPRPFDPTSSEPNGTKAYAMLLQRAGAEVDETDFPSGRTAVLFEDTLSARETTAVEDWVKDGGTLIVSDALSSFQTGFVADPGYVVPLEMEPQCESSAVSGVSTISIDKHSDPAFFRDDPSAVLQCFPASRSGFFMQVFRVGNGNLVQLGNTSLFTNARLDKDDNSVLATNLARPESGETITFLRTSETAVAESTSGRGLAGLVPDRVFDAIWLSFAAAALFIFWRWRRLGSPLEETPLVRIPASQLVVATGDLLEMAQQHRSSAVMIRDGLRRTLCDRFGLQHNIDARSLATIVSERSGVPVDRIHRVLVAADSVTNAEALVQYAQESERLQQEVIHVR